MAWQQRDLDALDKAVASGALTVRYVDRSVEYRSLDDMMRIRRMMVDELGLSVTASSSVRKLNYSKGIE